MQVTIQKNKPKNYMGLKNIDKTLLNNTWLENMTTSRHWFIVSVNQFTPLHEYMCYLIN